MYQILIDGQHIYHENIDNLKIFNPVVTLEQNAFGSFEFDIDQSNPIYNRIVRMKSLFEVYHNDDFILGGRIVEDGDDTYKIKSIYGEGELCFLTDSVQEHYSFQGSVEGFLEFVLKNHNEQVEDFQRFKLGRVTVIDPNDYITRSDTQDLNTWETIKKKLIELLGGYIVVRHENGERYIDYLADFDTLNSQQVKFGENMSSIKRETSGADIATIIKPYGAKLEDSEERLTIESVNGGKKTIENANAIREYGRRTKTVYYDDVTLPENLKRKAEKDLAESIQMISSIEITAVDMANAKKNIHNFSLYSKIHAISAFHNINDYFVPLKLVINLFKPENNKITLNDKRMTLTGDTSGNDVQIGAIIERVENIQNNYNVNIPSMFVSLQQELLSAIEQSATDLSFQISEKYYNKGNTDEMISELQTILKQTSTYFEMQFNSFSQDLGDILAGTNANFEEIRKFIRFINGDIMLGEIGNEFSLNISKDRISFLQGVQEVAYISNSKMYNTFVEVLNTLKIGRFGFKPRKNGNLTFKLMDKEVAT